MFCKVFKSNPVDPFLLSNTVRELAPLISLGILKVHGPFKKDGDANSNLFGRHVDYWQDKGRDYSSTRYSHCFTPVPGICYKSEKVRDDTSSGGIISGNDSLFEGNDYFPPIEKISINKTDVWGFVSESRDNSFIVNKVVWPPKTNNFGHSPSKTLLLFSPTTANSGTKEKWLLQKSSVIEQRISIGASLVSKKHRSIQWNDLNSTSSSSFFTDRCFTHR